MALKNGKRLPFRKPAGFWSRLARAIRFRLVVPMMRSQPFTGAHGARRHDRPDLCLHPLADRADGLAFAAWVVARRLFKWDFSLIQGLALDLDHQRLHRGACYYRFFLTGQICSAAGTI